MDADSFMTELSSASDMTDVETVVEVAGLGR